MEQKHHYTGLTDAQVLESRKKHGVNILTPPEEESVWDKIKDCMHFWLLKVDLAIFIVAALAATVLPLAGIYQHDGLWIAPVLLFILFALTYLVAYNSQESLVVNGKIKTVTNPSVTTNPQ